MKNFRRFASLAILLLVLSAASIASAATTDTYYHWDALGSPVAATDSQGQIIWREDFKPYGEKIRNQPAAQTNSRWYAGHPHDNATGLSYVGARWYDPAVGRFMAVDPQQFTDQDPNSFNRYAYGNNNPYRFVDLNGEWAEDLVLGVPSLAVGAYSLWGNIKAGNLGAATVDVVGMGVDVLAIALPGVPGGVGLGIKASREGAEAVAKNVDQGVIYRVPGNKTESGRPYIGSADDLAKRAKNARDGRDRTDAEIIGTYPKGDRSARRAAEQKAINENGGLPNLDNRRNEIAPSKWKEFGIE